MGELSFFGYFMLKRGAITREQLRGAVEYQKRHNVKIGDFAVAQGLLTPEQVTTILHAQRGQDRYFGELAMEMGFLTSTEVAELLARHRGTHQYLGEILVNQGALSSHQLSLELAAFAKQQEQQRRSATNKPRGEGGLEEHLARLSDLTVRYLLRIGDVTVKTGKTELRPILSCGDNVVHTISITGDLTAHYYLVFSRHIARRVTARLRQDMVTEQLGDDLEASMAIFSAIVVGNLAAKLAEGGITISVSKPVKPEALIRPMLGRNIASAYLHAARGTVIVAVDMATP